MPLIEDGAPMVEPEGDAPEVDPWSDEAVDRYHDYLDFVEMEDNRG
jgi:hypothetical protein